MTLTNRKRIDMIQQIKQRLVHSLFNGSTPTVPGYTCAMFTLINVNIEIRAPSFYSFRISTFYARQENKSFLRKRPFNKNFGKNFGIIFLLKKFRTSYEIKILRNRLIWWNFEWCHKIPIWLRGNKKTITFYGSAYMNGYPYNLSMKILILAIGLGTIRIWTCLH